MADGPQAKVTISADDSSLRQSLREMVGKVRDFGDEAKRSADGANGPLAMLRGHYTGLVSLIGGGVIGAFIKQHVQLQDELSKAAQRSGVTTEAYSGMAYAAKLADISTEQLTKTYAKLGATLSDAQQGQKSAVDLFQRLKLDPKNLRDADEMLLAVADRISNVSDEAAKTGLVVDIFGEKLGPQLLPFLNQGRAGLEDLRKEAERLGVVVSTEAGKSAEKFSDTLTKIEASSRGAGQKLAAELVPVLEAVADEFFRMRAGGSEAEGAIAGIRTSFEAIVVTGANTIFVLKGIGREIGAIVAQMRLLQGESDGTADKLMLAFAPGAALLQAIFSKGFGSKWTAISDAVKEDGERARAELEEFQARVMRDPSLYAGFSKTASSWGGGDKPFVPGGKPGGGGTAPRAKEAPASYLSYYEGMLLEEKSVQATLNAGREYTKQQELSFWRFLVENLQLTTADRLAVLRKMNTLEVQVAREALKERQGIDAADAQSAERLALARVDAEAAAARMALDLGQITKAQRVELELRFEADRYRIQSESMQERLRLLALDPESNPVEAARIKGEMLLLEQEHQTRRNQLIGAAVRERSSLGDSLAEAVGGEGMWQNMLNGMLLQAQSWRQALGNIFSQTGQIFLQELITKPAAAWLASLAKMLLIKIGFASKETAVDAATSSAKITAKGTEMAAVVGANAAEAGSGAAASQASIPYVGPVLALAAMAAVFAAVMSLGSKKSARGGYDIPSGVNPVVQAHEEEMILPSPLANGVRRLIEGGGAEGARAAAPAPVELRGASAGDFFIATRKDLLRVLNGAKRDFAYS